MHLHSIPTKLEMLIFLRIEKFLIGIIYVPKLDLIRWFLNVGSDVAVYVVND
jgi:hypothetical protein